MRVLCVFMQLRRFLCVFMQPYTFSCKLSDFYMFLAKQVLVSWQVKTLRMGRLIDCAQFGGNDFI